MCKYCYSNEGASYEKLLLVFMRSLGNASVHSVLETFPFMFFAPGIQMFVTLLFVISEAVFGLASVTALTIQDLFELRLGSRLWQLAWLRSKALSGVTIFCSLSRHFSLLLFVISKDYKWVAVIFREEAKHNENRRVALGARMLSLDLHKLLF